MAAILFLLGRLRLVAVLLARLTSWTFEMFTYLLADIFRYSL